jgi:hypothetical protein
MDHYVVHVTYAPLPSIKELENDFGTGNVSVMYDGRPWTKHASCAGIDETPGERVMFLKCFNRVIGSEEAIAEMAEIGYRPATHLEALTFAKVFPRLQLMHCIFALGSSATERGYRFVAALGSDPYATRRILGERLFDEVTYNPTRRFLFVRT